jgi:hypothetical protein
MHFAKLKGAEWSSPEDEMGRTWRTIREERKTKTKKN